MEHKPRKFAIMLLALLPAAKPPFVGMEPEEDSTARARAQFWQAMFADVGETGEPDETGQAAGLGSDAGFGGDPTQRVEIVDGGAEQPLDAGPGVPDAGEDAGPEDAGVDAGDDAGEDGGPADAGAPPPPELQAAAEEPQESPYGIEQITTGFGLGPRSGTQGFGTNAGIGGGRNGVPNFTGAGIGPQTGTRFGTGVGNGESNSWTDDWGTGRAMGPGSGTPGFGTSIGIGQQTGAKGFGTGAGIGANTTSIGAGTGFQKKRTGDAGAR
jgi:hypothetical protein